ncbi:MAG: hypothetical protein V4668_00320 [Patescibacteria group bacterium]
MAVYIITQIQNLVDEARGVQEFKMYTKRVLSRKQHSEKTLADAVEEFHESFLTTEEAKAGWSLVGASSVHVLSKFFYTENFDKFDDDLRPQQLQPTATFVI